MQDTLWLSHCVSSTIQINARYTLTLPLWWYLEETGAEYTDLLKAGTYGVATGWGKRCKGDDANCQPLPKLKQMQMQVQDDDKCTVKDFDSDLMFCAGDKSKSDIPRIHSYTIYYTCTLARLKSLDNMLF